MASRIGLTLMEFLPNQVNAKYPDLNFFNNSANCDGRTFRRMDKLAGLCKFSFIDVGRISRDRPVKFPPLVTVLMPIPMVW